MAYHHTNYHFDTPPTRSREEIVQPLIATQYARLRPASRNSSLDDSPYTSATSGKKRSQISLQSVGLAAKFSLSADPSAWGLDLNDRDPDDHLHDPAIKHHRGVSNPVNARALSNIGCLSLLILAILALFTGYPIYTYFTEKTMSSRGGFNIGGINASGQVPEMPGSRALIDADTPSEAYTFISVHDKNTPLQLVFSDEFNLDGRTFYPGDDPYWEAVDLHYWGTNNLEWYDPEQLITEGGSLKISLGAKRNHDLDYMGGMMSTWNKFCFTGGLIVANVMLPGMSNVAGLWPAVWTMGNLGRAGFGATNDGMWPYSYDACDVGTLPNQTLNGLPHLATVDGDAKFGGALSFLPGQRLSRCTCDGEDHPGPIHPDGSYVGRSAPEIDMIEAQVGHNFRVPGNPALVGEVSQSGQWAPFNYKYEWFDTPENFIVNDPNITVLNSYKGGVLQQATSCVSKTNQACYSQMGADPCFTLYGFEYKEGYDNSYITWLNDGQQVCTVMGSGLAADDRVQISARPVPQEPMYIITNLGMSFNFGDVDLANLRFPAHMYVDYIRVYQHPDRINIGCDPKAFPTKDYIEKHIEAFTNANFTTWSEYGQRMPKNRLIDQC
ncbi:beta-glucan synthesis-associated [Marasmius fiardii PR-910]|nr:beta-glucan synthesis-associated [Marasmius fiardii PR-910]